MPCFISFIICFGYNRVHFYAFSGTNLLTRCRSASCCFLLFLVSEILHGKYSRNRTGQKPNTLEVRGQHEDRRAPEDGHRGGLTTPRRGPPPGRAWAWWAHLGCPPTSPSRLYIPPIVKTLSTRANFPEKFRRSRHRRTHLGGFWSCLPALCRRGRSSPEASSSPCQPPRWCVSSSSQDYGSIAVARWLSSPICASCLVDLVSCLSWSRSFLCNPYVVFDGIRWILHVVLRLVINTSYFIICYFVILHALRC